MRTFLKKNLDKVGACASAICAVHCLLTGVAMSFLAVMGLGFLANPWIEGVFIGMAFVVGGFAVYHGLKRHHSRIPAAVFVAGIACILLSHAVGHGHDASGKEQTTAIGTALAVAGGLLVVAFHFVNSRLQHRGCGCRFQQ